MECTGFYRCSRWDQMGAISFSMTRHASRDDTSAMDTFGYAKRAGFRIMKYSFDQRFFWLRGKS